MVEPFISPNWHVIAIHFPLGLLGVGVLLEWLSVCCWPKAGVRSGARWMILMGALLGIPAITLGLYAFHDVAAPAGSANWHWHEVVAASSWSQVQWDYMRNHIWLEAIGTGLAVLAVVLWLAGSDDFRNGAYWPGLIGLTVAIGLMAAGAWFSGEAIYKYGTAVEAASPNVSATKATHADPAPSTASADAAQAGEQHKQHGQGKEHDHELKPAWVRRYIPPIQVHMVMAGSTFAFAMGALGLTIRRWSQPVPPPPAPGVRVTSQGADSEGKAPGQPIAPAPPVTAPAPVLQPIFVARFWVVALIFAILAALAGLWLSGDWDLDALVKPFRSQQMNAGNDRVFWHVLFGFSIVLWTFILAIATRVSRRAKGVSIFFIVVLLVAVAIQVWLGILMLYDTPHGPLTGFAG